MKKKYVFNELINKELTEFEEYLKTKNLTLESIKIKQNYVGRFLQYLENENLKYTEIRYAQMLSFIEELSNQETSKQLINIILLSVRNYYEFLKTTDKNLKNPAINIRLRGTINKIPEKIIKFELLEEIYKEYKTENLKTKRNKIILGLLVYQALTTAELHKLTPENILLNKAQIYVPAGRKTNTRTLNLQGLQVVELYEYLQKTRDKILQNIQNTKIVNPFNKTTETQLFISDNGYRNIKPVLKELFKEIRQIYPEIENAEQIRRSVLVYKLKTLNLRQVQYFAGHRYVSSTEKYLLNNIEDLKRQTELFHPLQFI